MLSSSFCLAQHYEGFSRELKLPVFLDITEYNAYLMSTQVGRKQKVVPGNSNGMTLSIGEVNIQNDTLILKDNQSGFKSYLKKTKNGYKILQGLPFLADDKFIKADDFTFVMFTSPANSETWKSIAEINRAKPSLITIFPGEYEYYLCLASRFVPRCNSKLIVNKDFSYKYYFKDLLVGSGSIVQYGKWLVFQDAILKMDFFATVCDSNSFASVTLPIYNQQKCNDNCKFIRLN